MFNSPHEIESIINPTLQVGKRRHREINSAELQNFALNYLVYCLLLFLHEKILAFSLIPTFPLSFISKLSNYNAVMILPSVSQIYPFHSYFLCNKSGCSLVFHTCNCLLTCFPASSCPSLQSVLCHALFSHLSKAW